MKTFDITVRTPLKTLYKGKALELQVDTEMGRMSVLPGHADLTAAVVFSRIKLRYDTKEEQYFVKNGVLHVGLQDAHVELLCISCDPVADIEMTTVEQYLAFVKDKLQKKENLNEYQLRFLKNESFALEKQMIDMKGSK